MDGQSPISPIGKYNSAGLDRAVQCIRLLIHCDNQPAARMQLLEEVIELLRERDALLQPEARP